MQNGCHFQPIQTMNAVAEKAKTHRFLSAIARYLLLAFVAVFSYRCVGFTREVYRIATLPRIAPDATTLAVMDKLHLRYKWRRQAGLLVMRIVLKNDSENQVSNVELTCDAVDAAGVPVDRNIGILYEIVAAGAKQKYVDIPLGFLDSRATKVDCAITNAKIDRPSP
jgi:hypothetical protein